MIAELGHFSLILALIAGLIQGFLPLAGTALGVRSWLRGSSGRGLPTLFSARSHSAVWLGVSTQVTSPS